MLEKLKKLSNARKIADFIDLLDVEELLWLDRAWHLQARRNQRPELSDWRTWILLGGRGSGKTRAGAEWIKAVAANSKLFAGDSGGRIALVGGSFADVRDVMIEGESGLLAIHDKANRPNWLSSKRQLEWPNGTIGYAFSSEDPEQLRGSQFGAAWCDELAKWPYLDATWNMLQFCLRLGSDPRQVVTTTPRALKILKNLMAEPSTIVSRSKTVDNKHHLAPGFIDYLTGQYGGTRLGRQELDGELIEDRDDALWSRALIEKSRSQQPEQLQRIVIAVDPPATSGKKSDACGIVAAGRDGAGKCYVLRDATIQRATPIEWANRAISTFHELEADVIIAEVNQGGEMVKTVLQTVDPTVPVKSVYASRGKWLRAEPVALLYERGVVHHVGAFAQLEDQMCDFGANGLSSGRSPDRLDALVWAIASLALQKNSRPRVRSV